jgi:uncharacterized protein GlcG (DUF336 family)
MKHLAAAIVMSLPICASAQDAFVEYKSLVPDLALRVAQTALQLCQDSGYQVGVTVVDRFGQPQVYLRDRYAGMHVFETSHRKAWTAVSFRTDTGDLAKATQAGEVASAIRHISQALPLAGGLVIYSGDGSIVGGVGVSGAPGPELDAVCAQAGIDAIEEDIAF